jgi:hypothetical protein
MPDLKEKIQRPQKLQPNKLNQPPHKSKRQLKLTQKQLLALKSKLPLLKQKKLKRNERLEMILL